MVTVKEMGVEFTLAEPTVEAPKDLQARAVFTNRAGETQRLNALFLGFATIVLEIRHHDGTPVAAVSPPLPPLDDGEAGRIDLAPGESAAFAYKGAHYAGKPLPRGRYRVRFRYDNSHSKHEEWTGALETEWLDFEVKASP